MDISAINSVARAHRATLAPRNGLPLKEIHTLPPLFDWVACDSGHSHFSMFLGGNDDGVALRFFWNGEYEATTLKAWTWFARTARAALDIGAHTGAFTLSALAANPALQVVSFEPHFMNFARLNLNLRGNKFATDAAFLRAVAARTEVVPFSISTGMDYLSTGGAVGERPGAVTAQVQAVDLDSFLSPKIKARIDLIKIDVEGFEGECIAGMRDILANARPVIFFECLETKSAAAVAGPLNALGYSFFEVDDATGTILPATEIRPYLDAAGRTLREKLNRIALPAGTMTAGQIN
jgi:FkbM family methyltransferase